jgi:hypothetical protein
MGRNDQATPASRRTFRHLESTEATSTTCRVCRTGILNGLSEGLLVRVDDQPIGQAPGDLGGEIQALLAGLDTFVLSGRELVHRDPGRIASGSPAGQLYQRHRCRSIAPAAGLPEQLLLGAAA